MSSALEGHPNPTTAPAVIDPARASHWFLYFCFFHLLLWVLVPALLYSTPPTDAAEGVAWGNLWQWGYEKHPFLAPWLSAGATYLFNTVGWPLYLLSQLSVVICFWATWRLALKVLTPWHALIAVVLLEGISYYNIQSFSFNPNILMLPLWALTTLVFYNALNEQKTKWWILLGICAGLSLLAKYESVILFIALFVTMFATQQGRAAFAKQGIYLAIIIALIVFSPNLIWLFQHHFDAVFYATQEMATDKVGNMPFIMQVFYHPLKFLFQQLGVIAPLFFLYVPFYQYKKQRVEAASHASVNGYLRLNTFDQRFLLIMGFGPLVITLLISLFANATLVPRWAIPFFSLLGILWVVGSIPQITIKKLKVFAGMVVGWNILLALATALTFILTPYQTQRADHYEYFPGQQVAGYVTQQWYDLYHRPLPYVAGTRNVVVSVAIFSTDKPKPYFEWNKADSPWIDENTVMQQGAVFVLNVRDQTIANQEINTLQKRFPKLTHASVKEFLYLTKAPVPPVKLWIAYLPPNKF